MLIGSRARIVLTNLNLTYKKHAKFGPFMQAEHFQNVLDDV